MRIKIILTFFFFVGVYLQSCCKCDHVAPFFDIQGVELIHIGSEGYSYSDTMRINDYNHLAMRFDVVYISDIECNHNSFSFMNTAVACDCAPPGSGGSKNEKISKLNFITLFDINDEYKKNDTINNFITVNHKDVETFVKNRGHNISSERSNIFFEGLPTVNSDFQIKAVIELSTGELYEALSNKIFLN